MRREAVFGVLCFNSIFSVFEFIVSMDSTFKFGKTNKEDKEQK